MYNCLCTDDIDYTMLCFPCDAEEQAGSVSAVSVAGRRAPGRLPATSQESPWFHIKGRVVLRVDVSRILRLPCRHNLMS